MASPLHILRPQIKRLPIILSCPHSGTEIPPDIAAGMRPEVLKEMADTDWFVHELYKFAPLLGITLIHARFSRYVIDLNRDPAGRRLYHDQRSETALVPLQTFAGASIYTGTPPDAAEISRRLDLYYAPYHDQIGKLISEMRKGSAHVLFFDAHSIRRSVPSIRPEPFADMILGDQNGKTAAPELTLAALAALRNAGSYAIAENDPFLGGYLTRRFGQPSAGVHALQLEMAQDIYMNEDSVSRSPAKESATAAALKSLFENLLSTLKQLKPI